MPPVTNLASTAATPRKSPTKQSTSLLKFTKSNGALMRLFAHRGANDPRLPCKENTLHAIRTAKEDGADGFEVDIVATKDGIPIALHDPTLRRTVCKEQNSFTRARENLISKNIKRIKNRTMMYNN